MNDQSLFKNCTIHFVLGILILLFCGLKHAYANDIEISNTAIAEKNLEAQYKLIQFDISWQNSWRDLDNSPFNYDAAWIFMKYRIEGTSDWRHASLDIGGHSAGTGTPAVIEAGLLHPDQNFHEADNPALGVFLYRSETGSGTFNLEGSSLKWNYGIDNVGNHQWVDLRIFAIEMVYVSQGPFKAGAVEGGNERRAFTITEINTPDARITAADSPFRGGYPHGQVKPESSLWPNGYNAFYVMKYMVTQQQYVDFLNTLTINQAANRFSQTQNTANRYGISSSDGVFTTTYPYLANNQMNWMDGAAFAHWAGLRPMSELEYEKASRGPLEPVHNEFAWGNSEAVAAGGLQHEGLAGEIASNNNANAVFGQNSSVSGPVRVGMFAKENTDRVGAGASFYGILDLSGNLAERTVTIGNEAGRKFAGKHGNGNLNDAGNATVSTWPGYSTGNGVSGAEGSGYRGGNWFNAIAFMHTADREWASVTVDTRSSRYGFRAVRTAPAMDGNSQTTIPFENNLAM